MLTTIAVAELVEFVTAAELVDEVEAEVELAKEVEVEVVELDAVIVVDTLVKLAEVLDVVLVEFVNV